MSVYLCPLAAVFPQLFTDVGIPLSGGKISTYLAGTSTPQVTYTDSTGITPNANPLVLNAAGRLNNVAIWIPGGISIKLVVTDANNNPVGSQVDGVTGVNDPAFASLAAFSNPATGFGADLVANAVRSYDSFTSMRAANVPVLLSGQTLVVEAQGGSAAGDGQGGEFWWSASATAADDGVNVIKPTAAGSTGRYLRLGAYFLGRSGTFTGTLTGMTAGTTGTVTYDINGNRCMLSLRAGAITGTSNTTALTMTGLPSQCQPATGPCVVPCMLTDNGVALGGWAAFVAGSGIVTFGAGFNNNTSGFTNSGTKGFPANLVIEYNIR